MRQTQISGFIGNLLFGATTEPRPLFLPERFPIQIIHSHPLDARRWPRLRKLIAFDDDTLDKLTQLARDRMGTFQELADEAFADLLKKHGIPIDLRDALRKSAGISKATTPKKQNFFASFIVLLLNDDAALAAALRLRSCRRGRPRRAVEPRPHGTGEMAVRRAPRALPAGRWARPPGAAPGGHVPVPAVAVYRRCTRGHPRGNS